MTKLNAEMIIETQAHVLALFNVLPAKAGELDVSHAHEGYVTNFVPSQAQGELLRLTFKPVNLVTLFGLTEARDAPLSHLLSKQVLHYFEVYGLDTPGLFNLEVQGGKTAVLRYIKAVSHKELVALVSRLINADAPIADVAPVAALVRALGVPYDINTIPNRELRVLLFNPATDAFVSGDDAVRWLCWKATSKALLIKDRATIAAVEVLAKDVTNQSDLQMFLSAHLEQLAQVFNRHKRLLVPVKNAGATGKRLINRISHMSKTHHVPVGLPAAKTVIARAVRGETVDLSQASLRDKFRYLNLIEVKLMGLSTDAFAIRNGKLWTATERAVLDPKRLSALQELVLNSLKRDLAHLKKTRILLDEHVDYGLLVSRKQTLGNLPYGTALRVNPDKKLSVGIYWRNSWGAQDLDLSAIDESGERIGWGRFDSYGRDDVTFSGDMTDATHGACEFFTVNPQVDVRRGLLVNIFRGKDTAGAEIIAGYPTMQTTKRESYRWGDRDDYAAKTAESWQDRTLLREKVDLKSKETLLGFLRGDRFVIYSGRLSNARVSHGGQPIVQRGLADLWTLGRLLQAVGVSFDTQAQPGVKYAHDLRYASFSLDKLERMFDLGK